MNRYYMGTSAYKLEDYEEYARKSQEKQQERKKIVKAEYAAMCRLLVIGIIFVFAAASALVYVNVMAMRASTDIDKLEKKLAMVIDENKQKEIEINQKLDMKVIEKKAIEKLGMQKPDNSQIVYVDVKKANSVFVAGDNVQKTNKFADCIKCWCSNIWEYFS